jgi:lipid II isoglutaminyl synthase (glutamine-hydrolysing)
VSGIRVGHLYPEHLNIYADRGNMAVLERRCGWRGIGFEVLGVGPGDRLPEADLYYLGGGQDRDQLLIAADIARHAASLESAVAGGAGVLAVCGGYQLLGHSYQLGAETLPGVGLIDLVTVRSDGPRLIGNVAIEVELEPGIKRVLAGFENHGGRTRLGPDASPLGRVLKGHGNNGEDGYEGVRRGSVIGTYLHGPLLPKNAWFADWLIETALAPPETNGPIVPLEPLDDRLEDQAHADARQAAGV